MNKSEQINELAAALAKAQAKIESADKSGVNTFYKDAQGKKTKYATLPSVWDACRKPLTDNGLSVVQLPDTSENGMVLESVLMHTSGQWISCHYPVNPTKNDPQGLGSALTYSRRYSLMALVGVVADDASEDDGNAASDQKEGFISEMMSAPTAAEANLTRLGYLKKEGMEAAEGGTPVLMVWWQRQLASDKKNLEKFKNEVLKVEAEKADKLLGMELSE